jgi:outer membrane protein assembly factor BamA
MYRICALIVMLTAALATSALAQEKPVAAEAAPPPAQDEGGFVDKAKGWAEEHQIVDRLNGDVDGWYPRLGGMTRGGGFALGPGYRFHAGEVLVDLSAGISMKAYKAVDAKVRWINVGDERFELWTNYRFEDFPQEDFFGRGFTSSLDNRTSYAYGSHEFSVHGLGRPLPWLRLGTTMGYLNPSIGAGSDKKFPSIELLFSDVEAPGLAAQPDFLHTTFFADVDYRDERGHPRSGGFYHTAYGIWNDRSLEQYDFRRFDANLAQYVPLVADKKHMVSGHWGVSYVNNQTGHRVPFYFLPYVGGVDTVRSFREFRFKDENAMWMTAEYNYMPIKWISVAAFVDAGKVAPDWNNIDFTGLKKAYGFGFRVHSRKQTFAKINFATGGGEGWQTFMKFGAGF